LLSVYLIVLNGSKVPAGDFREIKAEQMEIKVVVSIYHRYLYVGKYKLIFKMPKFE